MHGIWDNTAVEMLINQSLVQPLCSTYAKCYGQMMHVLTLCKLRTRIAILATPIKEKKAEDSYKTRGVVVLSV